MEKTVEDMLIELLEQFDVPVIRQGSIEEDEPYPEKFFTFWNNNTDDTRHYDNEASSTVYDFDVNFYSILPADTYDYLRDAVTLLKGNGFICNSDGADVLSDEQTHTGRGVNVYYLKVR